MATIKAAEGQETENIKDYVVFWAHFKSRRQESDLMHRTNENTEPYHFFNWVNDRRKEMIEKVQEDFVVTNCGIIK